MPLFCVCNVCICISVVCHTCASNTHRQSNASRADPTHNTLHTNGCSVSDFLSSLTVRISNAYALTPHAISAPCIFSLVYCICWVLFRERVARTRERDYFCGCNAGVPVFVLCIAFCTSTTKSINKTQFLFNRKIANKSYWINYIETRLRQAWYAFFDRIKPFLGKSLLLIAHRSGLDSTAKQKINRPCGWVTQFKKENAILLFSHIYFGAFLCDSESCTTALSVQSACVCFVIFI